MDIIAYILVVFAAAIVFFGLKIAAESERFVVTSLGRFVRVAGPGLLFRLPGGLQQWSRIRLGESGRYLGDGVGEFNDVTFPVKASDVLENDPIKIVSFRDAQVWVSRASERTVTCEKCGHEMRIDA
jgi:hypothetical protein